MAVKRFRVMDSGLDNYTRKALKIWLLKDKNKVNPEMIIVGRLIILKSGIRAHGSPHSLVSPHP
jgi:hypothetical protein